MIDDVALKLATIGVDPADVEHVVMSHLHLDHAGGLQFFPNANIYAQQSEIRFAYWPSCYQHELYDRDDSITGCAGSSRRASATSTATARSSRSRRRVTRPATSRCSCGSTPA